MPKVFKRRHKEPYVLFQLRLGVRQSQQLRVLSAELNITPQEFIIRMLSGNFPETISSDNNNKPESK